MNKSLDYHINLNVDENLCCVNVNVNAERNLMAIIGSHWKIIGNHKKIIGKNMVIVMVAFGPNMVKLYLNNRFNGLIDFFRSSLV